MKYIPAYLIIMVAFLCCNSPLRADETSKTAKAEELLKLAQGDQVLKMMEPMMNSMLAANKDMTADQRAKGAEMQHKLLEMVATRFRKATPALVKIYTDTYSEEELDAILAFYKSTAGKSFLQKMPEVMQRSMPVLMQMMSDLQPEIKSLMDGMMEKSKQ